MSLETEKKGSLNVLADEIDIVLIEVNTSLLII